MRFITSCIILLALIGLFCSTAFIIPFSEYMVAFRLVLLGLVFLFLVRALKRLVYVNKLKEKWKNILFSSLLVAMLLVILEGIFSVIPRSHGVGYTYGSKLWFRYYWKPQNSFGYRDVEPNKNKAAIFFVGDSFTAGHGIKKASARYQNLVCDQLDTIQGITIAKNGVDSRKEYEMLTDFIDKTSIIPKTIVLQYFGNDIDKVAKKKGINFEGIGAQNDMYLLGEILVNSSFLLNYIYWTFPKSETKPYVSFLKQAYENDIVLKEHWNDLQQFIDFANTYHARLVVVIFPFMNDVEMSKKLYVDKVNTFFKLKGISTLDVSELLDGLPPEDRVVNKNDGHASEIVHKRVANKLLKEYSTYLY